MLAIGATLATLAERLAGGEAKDLASQLPPEIGVFLLQPYAGIGDPFGLEEFFRLVSERAGIGMQKASLQAAAVIGVLCGPVSTGRIEKVRPQLLQEIRQLFLGENKEDFQ